MAAVSGVGKACLQAKRCRLTANYHRVVRSRDSLLNIIVSSVIVCFDLCGHGAVVAVSIYGPFGTTPAVVWFRLFSRASAGPAALPGLSTRDIAASANELVHLPIKSYWHLYYCTSRFNCCVPTTQYSRTWCLWVTVISLLATHK